MKSSTEPYNEKKFNAGNSIFPGFNDKNGIIICGYEYGYSKNDQLLEKTAKDFVEEELSKINTFYQKSKIFNSPYDLKIIKWFRFFGNPLGVSEGNSDFDKCILQTNWCDTQDTNVKEYEKFLLDENISNFVSHMIEFSPSVLIFMGSKQIDYLQNEKVKKPIEDFFGKEISPLRKEIKEFKEFKGRKFKIGFQQFERLKIVSFPHPSGSRGLTDEYIKLFSTPINEILSDYKLSKLQTKN